METLGAEIYKAQTLAIESLLSHHPEFDPAVDPTFSKDECRVFHAVFLPDWSQFGDDYRNAYRHFTEQEPSLMAQAQTVVRKFWKEHGVDATGLVM